MIDSLVGGGLAALISTIGVVYAAKAEKNSRPVGNGFTKYVIDELREIKDKLEQHRH